jgi:hypothetical protein
MTCEQSCVKQIATSLNFAYEAAKNYLWKGIMI